MRVFGQLHRDFRRTLIEYLDGLDPRRVHESTHGLGIQSRIAAVRPAVYDSIGRTPYCASSTCRGGRRTAA